MPRQMSSDAFYSRIAKGVEGMEEEVSEFRGASPEECAATDTAALSPSPSSRWPRRWAESRFCGDQFARPRHCHLRGSPRSPRISADLRATEIDSLAPCPAARPRPHPLKCTALLCPSHPPLPLAPPVSLARLPSCTNAGQPPAGPGLPVRRSAACLPATCHSVLRFSPGLGTDAAWPRRASCSDPNAPRGSVRPAVDLGRALCDESA